MSEQIKDDPTFKAGAEWMAEKAAEWLEDNFKDYVNWDGEVDDKELLFDFQRAMGILTEGGQQ